MNHFDIAAAQPNAWSILSRSYHNQRVASTYLFYGPDGLGHWPLAVNFAALLNCLDRQETGDPDRPLSPCLLCRHCRTILDLNFEGFQAVLPIPSHTSLAEAMDLTGEALAEKRAEPLGLQTSAVNLAIPIAMAREIARLLSRKADEGITRVVLFYRMEKMKAASADALLKLIEEPPPQTVIILTAERPEMLLPTIQSRSQKIKLNRVSENVIIRYLKEKYDLDERQATVYARLADGVPGKAIALAVDSDGDEGSQRELGMELFRSMLTDSGPDAVALLGDRVNPRNRGEADQLLRLWQSLIRDAHYLAVTGDDSQLTNMDYADQLRLLSPCFADARRTSQMIEAVKNALADSELNVHIQTALAALAFKLKAATMAADW